MFSYCCGHAPLEWAGNSDDLCGRMKMLIVGETTAGPTQSWETTQLDSAGEMMMGRCLAPRPHALRTAKERSHETRTWSRPWHEPTDGDVAPVGLRRVQRTYRLPVRTPMLTVGAQTGERREPPPAGENSSQIWRSRMGVV